MDAVLDTLRAQQRELERLTAEVSTGLREGDLALVFQRLPSLRALLSSHLAFKDAELYPSLLSLAGTLQPAEGDLVRALSDAMRALGQSVVAFLDSHPIDAVGTRVDLGRFRDELKTLLRILGQRMHDEELRLLPLLARLRSA